MRELLSATLQWSGGDAPPRELLVCGVRFRLSHLADGAAGAAAILCESPAGVPIPGYHDRRLIRRRVGGAVGSHLVIFTDAAHSWLVWSWETHGHLETRVYRELSFRPGQAWGPLRPVLESIAAGGEIAGGRQSARRGPCSPQPERTTGRGEAGAQGGRGPLESAIRKALLHYGDPDMRARAQRIQDLIEAGADAPAVRGFWHTLTNIRALDPACGEGLWLQHALHTLAAAYEAVLERMQSETDDLDRLRQRPRSDRLSDFRRLTRRAAGRSGQGGRSRFALELSLLHNLFGMDPSPLMVEACRRKLTDSLGDGGDPGLLSLNVRPAPGAGCASVRSPDLVARGTAAIRKAHLERKIDVGELSTAFGAAGRMLAPDAGVLIPEGSLIERGVGSGAGAPR